MNLASVASLAVAELDLKLVQDLVGAIRAADAAALAGGYSALSPSPAPLARSYADPEPRLQSRECVQGCATKTPCYERPRPCVRVFEPEKQLHALPRIALMEASSSEGSTQCDTRTGAKAAIQAPWEVRAWQEPVNPPARIKVVQYRTDILSKGSLIDMFI